MHRTVAMSSATPLVTVEELERQPLDYRYELVRGRIIRMSPVGWQHGRVVAQLLFLLKQYLVREPVGQVVTEVGFKLASQPDTLRGPDVAFVRRDRFPSPASPGFFRGHPDVAIEVRSPDERPSEVREKVAEYLSAGASVVVVVEPDDRTVTCHRPRSQSVTLTSGDRLDLGDVIPGFTCQVSEIFE